jgi:hypothetical protein
MRTVKQIEASLASARALVASLEATLAEATEPHAPQLLDSRQSFAEFGIGHDGLLAAAERGEIQLTRGARNKLLVERDELERWVRSRPVAPRQRLPVAPTAVADLEAWDREAGAALRSIAGGRR